MAQLVTVISFDDTEREVLGSGTKERGDAAGDLSKAINRLIKEVFAEVRHLADSNPSRDDLDAMTARLDRVRAIVNAVPDADGADTLSGAVAEIHEVVESARTALVTMR